MNLLLRAAPDRTGPDTRKILNEIYDSCHTCQTFKPRPLRFKASIPPEKIIFNNEISLDLMYLKDGGRKHPALHIVDLETGFANASFIPAESTEAVWTAFLTTWVTVYIGTPNKQRIDQGSAFSSQTRKTLADELGIELVPTGVQSHNSLGLGERYHDPLRRIFNKISHEYPTLHRDIRLRLAIKSMNDTMGPNGLVPSLLVFGVLPKLPGIYSSIPANRERFLALELARREYQTIIAQMRVKLALKSRSPPASQYFIQVGDYVLVYREIDSIHKRGKYFGPFKVMRISNKQVFVNHNGKLVQYNLSQRQPDTTLAETHDSPPNPIATHRTNELLLIVTTSDDIPHRIMVTEILKQSDPRCKLPAWKEAKRKELNGLISKDLWEIVDECEVEQQATNTNIPPTKIGTRWVLAIKNIETECPLFKARMIAQGYKDTEKLRIVHDARTMQMQSIRLIISLAQAHGFKVWSTDIKQAYIQNKVSLARDVYLTPVPELGLKKTQLLKLKRPIYGMAEAGDLWGFTFMSNVTEDLEMTPFTSDRALVYRHNPTKQLVGLMGVYTDDTIQAGADDFIDITKKTGQTFDAKQPTFCRFNFAGINIELWKDKFILSKAEYIFRLEAAFPEEDIDYKTFKSLLMRTSWVVHTRPDIMCAVAQLAQVTEKMYGTQHMKNLNVVIIRLRTTPEVFLNVMELDRTSIHVLLYTDASFNTNQNGTSQLGFIIALCDKNNVANILHYRSYKTRRVVRSVLAPEVCAFVDGFDAGYSLKVDLEKVLNRKVKLCLLADSKSIFDTITKGKPTAERRLMIDLNVARDAYAKQEISDIGHIAGCNNPADGLTRVKVCQPLEDMMTTGKADFPVEQWVERNNESVINICEDIIANDPAFAPAVITKLDNKDD